MHYKPKQNFLNISESDRTSGFTIIEVLLSMLIFIIVISGIIVLAGIIIKSNTYSKDVTTATTVAQDTIEEFIRKPFAEIVAHQTAFLTYNEDGGVKKTYNVNVAVTATPTATSKTVTVNVFWGSLGSVTSTRNRVSIDTILAPD